MQYETSQLVYFHPCQVPGSLPLHFFSFPVCLLYFWPLGVVLVCF